MNNNYVIILLLILASFTVNAQEAVLKGKVIDIEGNAVVAANVTILNTTKGASTNINGEYIIENLKKRTYFLEVSYLGFETFTKSIKLETTETVVDIVLEESSSQLSEVIITANRRFQDIQKTATSVSAIGAKEVSQLQIKEFNELSSIAPNFNTYDDGGTGIFTLTSVRGISTIDVNPVVGLYIDDIPNFSSLAFPLSLSDVEQIEVLRGPQGTLYGRNALAGVIKITSKKPTNTLTGFANFGYGNLNALEVGFGFNAPLIKDKLFARTSANITERDGFVTNVFNGKDLQNRKTIDINFRLKYYANDAFSIAFNSSLQRRESDAYAFVVGSPDNTLQDILEDPYKVDYDLDVLQEILTYNYALNLKYNFDKFSINAITAYQTTNQYSLDELDFSPFDIQSTSKDGSYNNLSQEFRLASTTESKLNWTTGIFLYKNDEERTDTTIYGTDIGFVVPDFATIAPFDQIDTPETNRKGIALFGQATYAITDKLAATAGLRFDYENIDASVTRTYSTPIITGGSFSEKANFDAVSPKGALSYQANDNIFLFANVAKGFRAGGINTFVIDVEDAPYDPETSFNSEIGIKTTLFDNKLKLNLTGFYINYKDQQVFTVVDLTNFVIGVDNIGESTSFGLEFESEWVATKGLNFKFNLGYLNTEVLDYAPVDFETGLTTDLSGKNLPLSPEFNGNLNANYSTALNKKINFEASIDYNFQSEFSFNFDNDANQEAYGLLSSRIGITSKNIDFFIWGKNITDKVYYSYGYGVGSFKAASFGLPQTYGATLTAKF